MGGSSLIVRIALLPDIDCPLLLDMAAGKNSAGSSQNEEARKANARVECRLR
jgi:hypothetical protein